MLVNFVAARHMTARVSELMPPGSAVATISSAASFGWENVTGSVSDLIATPDYASARQWCEEHPDQVGEGYLLSKQVIVIWTMHAAIEYAPKGIRVNCTSPGPTDTPMMPSFEAYMGKDFMDKSRSRSRAQLHARGAGAPDRVPQFAGGVVSHRRQPLHRRGVQRRDDDGLARLLGARRGPASVLPVVQRRTDLEAFFHPDAVAIVGSVNRNATAERLRAYYSERWGDRWYLVNAKGGAVGDITIYEHVTDIPAPITLAVVNVGTRYVGRTVEECGKHGVPYVLIFSAGFSEVGPAGAALEAQVGEIAEELRHPRLRTEHEHQCVRGPAPAPAPPGRAHRPGHAVRAPGPAVVQGRRVRRGLQPLGPDRQRARPRGGGLHRVFRPRRRHRGDRRLLRGVPRPTSLRRALEAANAERKPVIALKIGSTDAGTRMAASRTGHLTGGDAAVNGLFSQYGVVRVRDLDELLETSALFAKLPAGTGPRVALYSISGGSGALMAEVAESHGVPVPRLTERTQRALRAMIPEYLTVVNPVDNGAQFLVSNPIEDRRRVFDLLATDPNVDLIVVGLTGALGRTTDRFASDIVTFIDKLAKPVVVTWNSFKTDEAGFTTLTDAAVPLFRSFRNCFAALNDFAGYQRRPLVPAPPAAAGKAARVGGVRARRRRFRPARRR